MKKHINNIIFTCAVALSFIACTEDEIDTFSGTDTLYFQWSIDGTNDEFLAPSTRTDSTSVSFTFAAAEVLDSVFMVPVKVLGNVTSIDRPFTVEVLPSSTAVEGVHFSMPENLFIPANEIITFVPITLMRTPEMQTEVFSIEIGLVPNNHFITDYYGTIESSTTYKLLKYNEFKISVSDILTEPGTWANFQIYYLGDFSAKKFRLFAEVNEIPLPDNWDTEYPSIGTFRARVRVLKAYLQEQKNNGTPVLEEDGTEMEVGRYA